jgi:ABC-type lipoprotein export system ATPase subunit
LNVFLQLDEVVPLLKSEAPEGCQEAFHMEDSDFKWDGAESDLPTIRGISISAKKGSKIAIVGDVGCGKSSVLAALLGQIRQVRGETVRVYGTTAYMSQEAWLLNLTLRDNVTFGQEFQTEKYKEVIRVCSLQRDLTLLLSGDRTEIAERGANLSGGQRQRVSLARAVYYDADIILMDDPLSAVDQHVGRHIFEECILKYLANKTVVIVMNQLQYLQQMDHVIYLSNGSIKSQGTFSHLMESDIEFNTLVTSHVVNDAAIIDNEFEEEEPMNDASFDPTASREVHPVEVPHGTGDVEAIMSLNSLSIANRDQLSSLNQRVNESTVRSMIERQNRTSILGDATDVAELMSRNEASRYSVIPEASALKVKTINFRQRKNKQRPMMQRQSERESSL